jgi:hypothetical protein
MPQSYVQSRITDKSRLRDRPTITLPLQFQPFWQQRSDPPSAR